MTDLFDNECMNECSHVDNSHMLKIPIQWMLGYTPEGLVVEIKVGRLLFNILTVLFDVGGGGPLP